MLFTFVDVQTSGSNLAAHNCLQKGLRIDETTAASINNHNALLHAIKCFLVQNMPKKDIC